MNHQPALTRFYRALAAAGLLVVALVAWRFYSPYSVPRILESVSEDALNLWTHPYFHLGSVAVTPALLVKAFAFLLILAYFSGFASRLARRRVLDQMPIDEGQRFALQRAIGYGIFLVGVVVGLQSAGVELSSLLVVGGAVGVGIGLGLQTIAKNFASGLILLLERPVKVGDRVAVGELLGDVVYIGGRGTWIRTNDNVVVIVPNADFIENRVVNWTANDRVVRIAIPLGVSYDSDPEHIRRVLLDVARNHEDVLESPPPEAIFRGFGDSSLDFELRVWTTKQVTTPIVISSDLYYALFAAFQREGIEIPFPQRDLHLRSAEPQLQIANAG